MKKLASLILATALALTAVPIAFSASAAQTSQKISNGDLQKVLFSKTKIPATAGSATLDNNFWWDGQNDANLVFDGDRNDTKIGGYTRADQNTEGESRTVNITWKTASATPAYLVLFAGHDTGDNRGEHRNPASFELYGYTSDSDTTGTKLVTSTGDEMYYGNCHPTGWKIDTDKTFTSYKLVCKTSGWAFQLEEIELFSSDSNGAKPSESGITKGRYDASSDINSGAGSSVGLNCGFADGNVWFNLPIDFLAGGVDSAEGLTKGVQIYLNDTPTQFSTEQNNWLHGVAHAGFSNRNRNVSGMWLGVVGGKIVKGENKFTMLLGDSLYYETTFNSDVSASAVESSKAVYFPDLKKAEVTVTFADAVSYKKGDEIKAALHDEHVDQGYALRTFVVDSVSGKTVKFVSKDEFTTSHTILEFGADGSDNKFTVILNYAPSTEKVNGYIQTRPIEGDADHYDLRILAEGYEDYLSKFAKADISATLTLADGKTKDYTFTWTGNTFATVKANGETLSASDLCGYLGMVISKVPAGTKSVTAKIVFTEADGKTETVELGSATLNTLKAEMSDVTGKTLYDASKISVYTDEECKTAPTVDNDHHEDESSLFDGTLQKMCQRYNPVYFETENAITVTGLVFVVGNDSPDDRGKTRTFLTWKISGWDGSKWVEVASSDEPITDGESNYNAGDYADINAMLKEHPGNAEAFTVSGAGSYSRYKLEFTRNTNQQYTQMAELMLYTD